ncbi:microtubule-binding protein TANGLED1 isoform X2 [Phalaenopsis equestris]|uniref:microtubule-binding protein TANGLED1 isoform X2 n=1 Tax=Phalaenopsis equestris TaxID=78828 RepID=UPI0009E3779C|nr:microtubule-binding protein TANGLED1 isoform X2 [Phalaenopsis equestris]
MVAKSPAIPNRMNAAINPILVKETIQKFTVTGGSKFISGVKLSPRSTRGYFRTSLQCKQESLRMKAAAAQRSPESKFPEKAKAIEWRRMSLTAMLLNETVAEILQTSKLVSNFSIKSTDTNPRTPETGSRSRNLDSTELRAKRAKEKHLSTRTLRSESGSPVLRRTRSRITFKTTSPLNVRQASMNLTKARPMVSVDRITPKNKPWMKKTVLFTNPLFHSTSPTSTQQKSFYKTRSPIITRRSQAPHKFLIKSQRTTLHSQLKSKKAVPEVTTVSPVRNKESPAKQRRCSFYPSKFQNKNLSSQFKSKKAAPEVTISPIRSKASAAKQRRCTFSPSKFANRLVSPLKARLSFQKGGGRVIPGLEQRHSWSISVKQSSARLNCAI